MSVVEVLVIIGQSILLFILGAAGFDVVHYILHVWETSRFRLLRFLGGLHAVHHEFLDRNMVLQRQYSKMNILNHVLPEYLTGTVGAFLLSAILGWWIPGVIVVVVRTIMVVVYCFQKGEDFTHAELKRVPANRSLFFVGPAYHALHHVYVRQHYSSFLNVFDLVFGTNCQIRERKFLVTGARGAFGSAMVEELKNRGAEIETAQFGVDFTTNDYSRLDEKLTWADVVILAHGAKREAAWSANYLSFVQIIERFREIGKNRLVPPEVWAVGSEIEIHSHFNSENLIAYAESKRAFALEARRYYSDQDLIYRHIVPSAFTSKMGPGLMSAKTVVKFSLFFITRGFCYVPVTYTTFAFWNYFKFLTLKKEIIKN